MHTSRPENFTIFAAIIVFATMLVSPASAQTVAITNSVPTVIVADATMNNSLALTVDDVNFGIIAVSSALGQTGELELELNGAYDLSGNIGPVARIIPRAATGQQGVIDVAGALPSTMLNIRYSNVADLDCGLCSVGNPDIVVSRIFDDMPTQAGLWSIDDADPDNDATTGRGMTDGSGELTINIGAAIRTESTNVRYESGFYEGTFDVILEY